MNTYSMKDGNLWLIPLLMLCAVSVSALIAIEQLIAAAAVLAIPGLFLLFRFPILSIYLLIALIPLESFIFNRGNAVIVQLAGLGAVGFWLMSRLVERKSVYIPTTAKWLFAIILFDALSIYWAHDSAASISRLFTEVQLLIFYIMIVDMIDTEKQLSLILLIFAATSTIVAALGLQELLSGGLKRLTIEGYSISDFGNILALGAVISLAAWNNGPKRYRLICLAFCMLFFAGLLASASRTNLAAAIVAIIITTLLAPQTGNLTTVKKISLLASAALVLPLVWYGLEQLQILPAFVVEHLSIERIIATQGTGRGDAYRVAWQIFLDNPIIGVGLDNTPGLFFQYSAETRNLTGYNIGTVMDPHNDFLRRLAEVGIIGFAFFMTFLIVTFNLSFRSSRLSTVNLFLWSATFGMASLMMAAGMAITYQWRKRYWLALALIVVLHKLTSRHMEHNEEESGKMATLKDFKSFLPARMSAEIQEINFAAHQPKSTQELGIIEAESTPTYKLDSSYGL